MTELCNHCGKHVARACVSEGEGSICLMNDKAPPFYKTFHMAQYEHETGKPFPKGARPARVHIHGSGEPLRAPRLRPAMPEPVADLYFFTIGSSQIGAFRVKKAYDEPGYHFQVLDANMDIQVDTYHVSLPDALEQVVRSMRAYGGDQYRVEGF